MNERIRLSEIYLEHVLAVHAVAKRTGVGFATAMLQAIVPWLKAQELTEKEQWIVRAGERAVAKPKAQDEMQSRQSSEATFHVRGEEVVRCYVAGRLVQRHRSSLAVCEALIAAAESCGTIGFHYAKLAGMCREHHANRQLLVAFQFLRLVGAFVPHASGEGSRSRLAPDARAKLAAGAEAHREVLA